MEVIKIMIDAEVKIAVIGLGYVGLPLAVEHDFRAGDVRHSQANIAKAQRLLGYAPTHSLAEGITQAMSWYVAQNNESKQALVQ